MKTQTVFQNSSLVSVVNGSIVVKDSTGREHTFTNASIVSVNNGTIIIESKWNPKKGELIKYRWAGDIRYGIFKEMSENNNKLWTYGCSIESLSEFPNESDCPKFRYYNDIVNLSPVTPEEQKQFDDFCKSKGKIWNKETLQWENYRRKPKYDEVYYTIHLFPLDSPVKRHRWIGDNIDKGFYQTNNCFKTKEEAEAKLKQIKKLLLEA